MSNSILHSKLDYLFQIAIKLIPMSRMGKAKRTHRCPCFVGFAPFYPVYGPFATVMPFVATKDLVETITAGGVETPKRTFLKIQAEQIKVID